MIVDLPRRWRWIVAAECALVTVLAIVFIVASRSAERLSRAAQAAPAAARATVGTVPDLPARPVAAVDPAVDQVEACGAGWVRTGPSGTADPAEIDRLIGPAADRILAQMRADSSDMVRASAALLDPSRDLDALARVAVSSTDPAAYALAFRECHGRPSGACQLLSADRWAQLDPENASPWVYLFEAARRRGDRAAQQEDLFHIASAKRSRSGAYDAVAAVLDAAPDDDASRLAASILVAQAIGIEATVTPPDDDGILAACRGDALTDANRLQVCGAIAEQFTEHSDSLSELQLGARIGRQVGWTSDRADLLSGQGAAYLAALAAAPMNVADLGCDAVARRLDLGRQHAAGEPAAMRAWVKDSGRSSEEFIREERALTSTRKFVR